MCLGGVDRVHSRTAGWCTFLLELTTDGSVVFRLVFFVDSDQVNQCGMRLKTSKQVIIKSLIVCIQSM